MLKFEVVREWRSVSGFSHPRGCDRWAVRDIEYFLLPRLRWIVARGGACCIDAEFAKDLTLNASGEGTRVRVVIDSARLGRDVTPESINAALARLAAA